MLMSQFLSLPLTEDASVEKVIAAISVKMNRSGGIYTFINPYSYFVAAKNKGYCDTVSQFDGVFADGIGVVTAARLLGLRVPHRLSFDSTSLAPHLFSYACEHGLRVHLIGGKEGVAQRAAEVIGQNFPGIAIVGTASGYFTSYEEAAHTVMETLPDMVICGMGAPRQDELLLRLRQGGWQGVGFSCGGYLDQLGDGYQYYPEIVNRLNIRFLYRLFREPRRLWKRYLVEYRVFFFGVASAALTTLVRGKRAIHSHRS
jgi:N-acetylglucosaminyldiphosphoundecaprenol N-acetyl-beta-D-mannosaminyltransferase